jgi:hypothetical protein
MSEIDDIRKSVRKIVGKQELTTYLCKVESVDWDKRVCHVSHDSGIEFFKARLRSVLNNKKTGICLKPKKGSMVLVQVIEGVKQAAQVIGYEEIESVEIIIDNTKFVADKDGLVINDGNNKGVPILDKIKDNFDAIKKYLDIEKQAISAGIKAVGAALAANGAAGATAFDTAMASNTLTFTDMENKKVKH